MDTSRPIGADTRGWPHVLVPVPHPSALDKESESQQIKDKAQKARWSMGCTSQSVVDRPLSYQSSLHLLEALQPLPPAI
jgi:hypothetical protein